MPINFDPNSLNSVFDKNFGAGAYNAGLSNARNAAMLKAQANFAKTDYLKRLKAAQAAATKAQKAASKKTYQDAVDSLNNDSTTLDTIKNQGAYKAAEDIKNDPTKKQAIKDQGYNVQDYIDAMYNAASNGKFKSERDYNSFAGNLDKSNTDKKANQDSIDLYLQKAKAEEQQKNIPKQNSFADKAKSLALGAMDLIDRPGNAVRTGIKDAMSGKGFLQGAKEGLLGQDHTSGVQLLQKAGLDPNNNAIAKSLLNGVATGLQINPTSKSLFGMVGKDDNRGQRTAGLATEIALDPLSYLGAKVPKVKPGVSTAEDLLRLGSPQERLGLPAPQPKLNAPQLQLEAPKPSGSALDTLLNVGKKPNGLQNPIPSMPSKLKNMMIKNDLQNSWLDFGQNTKNLPKARPQYITNLDLPADPLNRGQQYWQQRYEDFVKYVNDNGYTSNNLSHDAINELWTHFAKNNEPVNIDQVAELAYPKGYQAPPKAVESPPQAPPQPTGPTLKDALASDPRIKQQIQALFPNGSAAPKISRPATLEEMVQRLQDMAPPKQQPKPLEPLQFRKLTDMERQIKPGTNKANKVSDSPLFLNPNSLKTENILKTTSISKTLDRMSKDELQTVYKQLQDKKTALAAKKTKASKKQIQSIDEDMKKVNDFLMKSNLQIFGQGTKKKPISDLTPREKKAQKKAVADFTDKAKKAGIDPTVRKAIQKTENVGAMLKGAKNINEMADKLPKEMGNQVKQSLKMVEELKKTKDILPTQTLTKNVYELADKLPKEMKNKIISELDKGKTAHINNMETRSNALYDQVVKGLGIEKGSKESALVQDFGEKTLGKKYLRQRGIDPKKLSDQELANVNLQQLKKLHPNDWQKIVKADEYLRNDYKKIISEVNATVKKIYPTTYEKHMVKERSDYFHHFQELTGFEGFKNMVESSSAIDPHLAGISSYTQPKTKWQGFKQERKNGSYKSDAIGGYLRYLQASSYSTHIDPVIKTLRDTANQIAEATKDSRNMNNIKSALVTQADNLAGKTNPIDRLFQDHVVGRKVMNVANVVNSHIKKNMILGNLGSALGQIGNVPLAIGKAKQFAAQGAMDTLKYAATHLPGTSKGVSEPLNQSKFLKERYSSQLFTRFDTGLLKKPEKMAAWLIETADKSGTYFTWNSMYRKGLSQGVTDPIKYADTETRHIVAGRGVGEIPVAQKAKITQLVVPFSLEVGNQWKVLGKQVTEKDFAGIITFLAASYGLNVAMNNTKGSDASYNPIGALIAGINKDPSASGMQKTKNALANLSGETVGNIPGGNYIPQVLGLISQNQKEALFGDRSPDRFGTGLGVASTVFKPATDLVGGKGVEQFAKDLLPLVAPLGGNQARKTWNGIEGLAKGGSYNGQGKLQYPIDANNPSDTLHSLMFGPTTTAQGRDYYNKKQQPLSAKQTAAYQNSPDKQAFFNSIQSQRQVKAIQKKIQDIQKDPSLSPDEKLKSIFSLTQLLQNMH